MDNESKIFTITKDLGDYPAAHRQPFHGGHCAQIHGHNWRFVVTLGCSELDKQGFVYDFGNFGSVKDWLRQQFDHTLLLQADDPKLQQLKDDLMETLNVARIIVLESVSCEGIAAFVYDYLTTVMADQSDDSRNIFVMSVTVHEDDRNSATCC